MKRKDLQRAIELDAQYLDQRDFRQALRESDAGAQMSAAGRSIELSHKTAMQAVKGELDMTVAEMAAIDYFPDDEATGISLDLSELP